MIGETINRHLIMSTEYLRSSKWNLQCSIFNSQIFRELL